MKKLFLFTLLSALTISLASCSSDDNNGSGNGGSTGGTLTVKINGTQKTFNTITVNKEAPDEDGDVYLDITASINGSADEMINFGLYQGDTGSNTVWNLEYKANNETYNFNPNFNVLTNNNNQLKGTFSGQYKQWDNDTQQEEVLFNFTEGSFDIRH